MKRISTIEIQNDKMKFSVGHFTIFSETDREDMHGHDYHVSLSLTFEVDSNGITFDYRFYKEKLYKLCKALNSKMLFAEKSPYLTYGEKDGLISITFANETMYLLPRDVVILPLANISIEELSRWFVEKLTEDKTSLHEHKIHRLQVKVGPLREQTGSCEWIATPVT